MDVVFKKLHLRKPTKKDFEKLLMPHRDASFIAQEFNSLKPLDCPCITYVPACLVQFSDRRATGRHKSKQDDQPLMICELRIKSPYEKYNNNSGIVNTNPTAHNTYHEAVQAFSHFSFQLCEGRMMVVDCQGGYDEENQVFQLADPVIHSTNVLKYGGTNMEVQGMNQFFKTHCCNGICAHFGLETGERVDWERLAQSIC
ncbi:hypothetical protein EON65_26130 [archaeon]|nr:MAG: hypothetical protein EON65_26130 [archaeon]